MLAACAARVTDLGLRNLVWVDLGGGTGVRPAAAKGEGACGRRPRARGRQQRVGAAARTSLRRSLPLRVGSAESR